MKLPASLIIFVKCKRTTVAEFEHSSSAVTTYLWLEVYDLPQASDYHLTPIVSKPRHQQVPFALIFEFVGLTIIIVDVCLPLTCLGEFEEPRDNSLRCR